MNSRFLPFVWVLIGSVRFSTVRSSFRSVFLEFLAVRAVFNRLFSVFFRLIAFLVRESGACWRSGGFVVKLQVSVKVSTSESIGVLLQLCLRRF